MIYFLRKKVLRAPKDDLNSLKNKLKDAFEIEEGKECLWLSRSRVIGNGGVLRLLFPKFLTKVTLDAQHIRYRTRLDGVAFFMVIMILGAVVVEFTAPRDRYPREYPIEFPLGLAAWYFVNIVVEFFRLRRVLPR